MEQVRWDWIMDGGRGTHSGQGGCLTFIG
jgi:hypothetical protein